MLMKANKSFSGFGLDVVEGRIIDVEGWIGARMLEQGLGVAYKPVSNLIQATTSFEHPALGSVEFDQILDVDDFISAPLIDAGWAKAIGTDAAQKKTKKTGRK